MCHATLHGPGDYSPCLRKEAMTVMGVLRLFRVRNVVTNINPAEKNSHVGFISVLGIFPPPDPFAWGWVRKFIWYLS